MDIYRITKLIKELEQVKNPYSYDLELLEFYKKKKEILIMNIKNLLKKEALSVEEYMNAKKYIVFDPKNYLWDTKQGQYLIRKMS
tara:strand:+ start:884 stop:1138 length:255 start_codon:yes stop_codon:yes gene_type:complete